MRVDATYTYHCDIAGCGRTETQHVENRQAVFVRGPVVPRGWAQVGILLFCPVHSLLVQVDGHEVPVVLEDEAPPPP